MSTAHHLTLKDYFDRAITRKFRTRKAVFSSRDSANISGSGKFQRLLASRQIQRAGSATVKSTGLTIRDYLACPVALNGRYHRLSESQLAGGSADKYPGRRVISATKNLPGKDTASSLSAAEPRPLTDPSAAMPAPNPSESHEARKIEASVQKAANKYGLSAGLIKGVIRAESNFQVDAVSRAGAQGLMQLMPATAKELGVTNPFDIDQNNDGGARYLRKMLDSFGGDVKLALAAYNAGPGTVRKYAGNVPYPETIQYVDRVLRFSEQIV